MPTSLPGVIVAAQQAFTDPPSTSVTVRDARAPSLAYTRFSSELDRNWDFYDWLARTLPADARLLTPYPAVAASLAGVSAPTSGRSLQVLSVQAAPVYEDALRFLHRDDLADMDITHLHVTDRLEAAWPPDARRLLTDPAHFTLVADRRSVSGMRHRLYAVAAGAGTTVAAPGSYRPAPARALRRPLSLLGGLTPYHRKMLLMAFADHPDVQTVGTFIDRASRFPRGVPLRPLTDRGVVVLPATVEPIALGLSRPEAIWTGYELRAYNLATAAWSPVGRVGPRPAPLPDPLRSVCDAAANGQIDLRVLGEPGTVLAAGPATLTLTGLPQILTLTVPDCRALTLSAPAALAPFVQLRPHHPAASAAQEVPIAALAFDGVVVGQRAVLNLWYRNPRSLTFATGSELRLYTAGPLGVSLRAMTRDPAPPCTGGLALCTTKRPSRMSASNSTPGSSPSMATRAPATPASPPARRICWRSPSRAPTPAPATWKSSTSCPSRASCSATPAPPTRCSPASPPSSSAPPAPSTWAQAITAR